MFDDVEREVGAIRLPKWGRVVPVDGLVPWLVVEPDGPPVEPIRRFLVDFVARVRRSIPLRVGLVDVMDGQRVTQARDHLTSLGVTEIGTDGLRQVGRGLRTGGPDVSQLCGNCARAKVAVSPTGAVWPCVFARWMPVGNVHDSSLDEIVTGPDMASAVAQLGEQFGPVTPQMPCVPKMCDPDCGPNCGPACNPSCWPHGTGPCGPNGGCKPHYE
ncbi:MAG: SPASM domain-containing protein [Mycobacterium sp.]|nr:SPASM domain-containing protein [Mycobacterium sp.]